MNLMESQETQKALGDKGLERSGKTQYSTISLKRYPLGESNRVHFFREKRGPLLRATQIPTHFRAIPPQSTPSWQPWSGHGRHCPRRSGSRSWRLFGADTIISPSLWART
jgi:hypothetical protein